MTKRRPSLCSSIKASSIKVKIQSAVAVYLFVGFGIAFLLVVTGFTNPISNVTTAHLQNNLQKSDSLTTKQQARSISAAQSLENLTLTKLNAGNTNIDDVIKDLKSSYASALNAKSRAQQIIKFLDTGKDFSFNKSFVVSSDGFLKEAPTLRVLLLDQLASLDSELAATYATTILNNSQSVNEWAIALRNYAWESSWQDAFLKNKVTQLINKTEWANAADGAFLESFDAVVFTKSVELIPALSTLASNQDNPALRHAAQLSLDRLVSRDPEYVMQYFLANSVSTEQSWVRASSFARADVSDPLQEQLLERYLLDHNITPEETKQFFAAFPRAQHSVGNFLITSLQPESLLTQAQLDQASLVWVDSLLRDTRFSALQTDLRSLRDKLWNFVQSAQDNGFLAS